MQRAKTGHTREHCQWQATAFTFEIKLPCATRHYQVQLITYSILYCANNRRGTERYHALRRYLARVASANEIGVLVLEAPCVRSIPGNLMIRIFGTSAERPCGLLAASVILAAPKYCASPSLIHSNAVRSFQIHCAVMIRAFQPVA